MRNNPTISPNEPVDYKNLNNWAAHPLKKDPSDQIPSNAPDQRIDSLADVFFIYPTTYTDDKMAMGWNANIDDKALNKKTDNSAILYQASVFNRYCRVYAPRYRQANIAAFYSDDKQSSKEALDRAYKDVKAAFQYYLKYENHGRPIIIASHSQGTLHAGRLLREFFENKPLEKQLVAAYIIGLPVFTDYFTAIKPCKDSSATGCFVTWRTFEEGYIAPFVQEETRKAIVINPLTWSTDTTMAPATLNKGGMLRNFNKLIPGLVQAQIHGNVLWVNKPRFLGSIFIKTKNYHIADYNFFYENIRDNAGVRINSFLNQH
ncbi:MAG: DUF3089 domain-containing protein [Ginsengibacter sp.]